MRVSVEVWLNDFGLGQNSEAFGASDNGVQTLSSFDRVDFKELSVTSLGYHKKKLVASEAP